MRHPAPTQRPPTGPSHIPGRGERLYRTALFHIPSAALFLCALIVPALSADYPDEKAAGLPVITPARRIPAVSLLPDGCVLRDATIPRYDKNLNLTSVLQAKEMILLDAKTIKATRTRLIFFNSDRSQRAHIELQSARYDQETGILRAKEAVSIVSQDFRASGTALIFVSNTNQSYLYGPVDTYIHRPPNTAMQSPLKPAAVLASTVLASAPLQAAPPERPSPKEIRSIQQDAAHSPSSESARQQTSSDLDASRDRAAEADARLRDFTRQTTVAIQNPPTPPAGKPLEIPPSPEDTRAECDDGMFFDSNNGILIYLKNVRVSDPRFTLTGADELKVFLEKKEPAKPAKTNQPAPPPDKEQTTGKASADLLGGAGAGLGDVDHIVANGRILLVQKPADATKPPVEGSSALLNYNAKTGEIILTGGYPWVRQGTTYMRALQPDLNIRIQKDGSFATSSGHWETGGRPKDIQHPSPKTLPANPNPSSH